MEIKRLGENKIRCALSEDEIQEMGFEIDDIIGNTETTQRFMRVVLKRVEQEEKINLANMSPMVKAELLQDHSMAITFGGDTDFGFKNMVDTVNNLLNSLDEGKLAEFKTMGKEEKQGVVDELLKDLEEKKEKEDNEAYGERIPVRLPPMICGLQFQSLEQITSLGKNCFLDKYPNTSLYKIGNTYHLILDFKNFTKDEMRPFAFGAVEYGDGHLREASQLAFIKEHGRCIMKKDVLETLMQL